MRTATQFLVLTLAAAALPVAATAAVSEEADECRTVASRSVLSDCGRPASSVLPLDPCDTFDRVVERYRDLTEYEDSIVLEQITARSGERAVVEETQLRCEMNEAGELEVTTPQSQASQPVGLGLLFGSTPWLSPGEGGTSTSTSTLEHQYNLWLAPHMTLRYADEPLAEFRTGVDEGFTPVKAEKVTQDDRELVRIDLQSGDGLSEDYRARFELFVDPETLLITRVRGVQLLPDGANLVTDYAITPKRVVTADGRDLAATTKRTAI